MKYAKIENSIVIQIQPNNELGFMEVADDIVCGMLYDNATGTFSNPPAQPAPIPTQVTMRQARLALLQSGLLQTVTNAIANGTDEAMKIEWEYATEVDRDWPSLVTLASSLGMTDSDLDNLFVLAASL